MVDYQLNCYWYCSLEAQHRLLSLSSTGHDTPEKIMKVYMSILALLLGDKMIFLSALCVSFLDFNNTMEARIEMVYFPEKFVKELVCFKAEINLCKWNATLK